MGTSVEKRSTATMAVESTPPEPEVFLDTSLIIAATVGVHPAHQAAASYVDKAVSISPQVCREFLVVLTRQPVSERVFGLDEALSALRVWTTGCRVLDENAGCLSSCSLWSRTIRFEVSRCTTATLLRQCWQMAFVA